MRFVCTRHNGHITNFVCISLSEELQVSVILVLALKIEKKNCVIYVYTERTTSIHQNVHVHVATFRRLNRSEYLQ